MSDAHASDYGHEAPVFFRKYLWSTNHKTIGKQFLITSLVPGDPIIAMLGDLAASKPAIVAEYRAKWGLDLPLWQQYWIFLTRLFHGMTAGYACVKMVF